jgi:hypothetical protein
MNAYISKTNDREEFFNSLLDEVRMSGHERLRAKARLAQAEAFADAAAVFVNLVKNLVKSLAPRPHRRPTTLTG